MLAHFFSLKMSSDFGQSIKDFPLCHFSEFSFTQKFIEIFLVENEKFTLKLRSIGNGKILEKVRCIQAHSAHHVVTLMLKSRNPQKAPLDPILNLRIKCQ